MSPENFVPEVRISLVAPDSIAFELGVFLAKTLKEYNCQARIQDDAAGLSDNEKATLHEKYKLASQQTLAQASESFLEKQKTSFTNPKDTTTGVVVSISRLPWN